MLASHRLLLLVMLSVLAACAGPKAPRFQDGNGALASLLCSKVKDYSGQQNVPFDCAALEGSWEAREDKFGILVRSPDIRADAVLGLLTNAYGAAVAAGFTPEGRQQWAIPARKSGAAIWVAQWKEGVEVTVNRPMTPDAKWLKDP